MARLEKLKIDSRGRVVLPQAFRKMLGLKENDTAYAVLDEENRRLLLSASAEEPLVYLEVLIADHPGALAKAASVLEQEGLDLVSTESHSVNRGSEAVWRVTARCDKRFAELKAGLLRRDVRLRVLRRA